MAGRPFSKPIRVANSKDRTYKNVVYHSKMEMQYAMVLDDLVEVGALEYWLRQVPFQLGPDNSLKVDFVCFRIEVDLALRPVRFDVWAVDVKGYKQKGWGKTRTLWKKYADIELRVLTKKGGWWETIEVIEPDGTR